MNRLFASATESSSDSMNPPARSKFCGVPDKQLHVNGKVLNDAFIKSPRSPRSPRQDKTRTGLNGEVRFLLVGGEHALIPILLNTFRTGVFPEQYQPEPRVELEGIISVTDANGEQLDGAYSMWSLVENEQNNESRTKFAYENMDVIVMVVNMNDEEEYKQIKTKHDARRATYCPHAKTVIIGVNYQALVNLYESVSALKDVYDNSEDAFISQNRMLQSSRDIGALCYYEMNFTNNAQSEVSNMFNTIFKLCYSVVREYNYLGDNLHLRYNYFTDRELRVNVRSCTDLYSSGRVCSPYVILYERIAGKERAYKTSVVKENNNPLFHECFKLKLNEANPDDSFIDIEVWDHYRLMSDKLLGICSLRIADVKLRRGEVVAVSKKLDMGGEIILDIVPLNFNGSD
ncbi:hypothetical protein AKO1_000522 [Acrasis kona]|uniref:C2 domain-containing protein n=1 Tax=Acrasis kona TaxID=1008807 RepID=A0AAW2ZRN7_9EUKA